MAKKKKNPKKKLAKAEQLNLDLRTELTDLPYRKETTVAEKAVDLGVLQENLIAAKRRAEEDAVLLDHAIIAADKSKEDYSKAIRELKDATRAVLGQ
jgi:hypothetical protein